MATRASIEREDYSFEPPIYDPHVASPDERLFGVGIALVDAVVILLSGLTVLYLRFFSFTGKSPVNSGFWRNPTCQHHVGVFIVFAALTILTSNSRRLYEVVQRRSAVDEAVLLGQAIAIADFLLTALLYFVKASQVSRLIVGFTGIVAFCGLLGWRLLKRRIVLAQMVNGYGCRNVLIIGEGETGRKLARYLNINPQLGYKVCGFLSEHENPQAGVLGRIADVRPVVMANFIDEIIVTISANYEIIGTIVAFARERDVGVKVMPNWLESMEWTTCLRQLGDVPVVCIHDRELPAASLAIKRGIDILSALSVLIVFAPVFLTIAILVRFDSRGSAFYRSRRIGRRGREFDCFKFRTMVTDADQHQHELQGLNERSAILFKIKDDPRITRLGRLLRKYSVDELPQFWNVLRGDMSLVGPRPPIPSEVRLYELEHLKRIDMTPGITGLWQISARCNPSFNRYIQCDLEYTDNWSLGLDLKIMLKTIPVVLRGTGQ